MLYDPKTARKLPHANANGIFIQHDYDFYSTVYYKSAMTEPIFFLKNQTTGEFELLPHDGWYMVTVMEKLQKLPANEKQLIDRALVCQFWDAIREGYNHMLDPNLKNQYDSPRIQNSIKAIRAYIERIRKKQDEQMEKLQQA